MPASEPYSGTESFRFVEKLLREERRILISTPYISPYYARMLAGMSSRKRIYLITSREPKSNAEAIRYLQPSVGLRRWAVVPAIASLLLSFVNLYASAMMLLLALLFLLEKKNSMHVKFAKASIHEKLYIGENEAIVGSANLTNSGMHSNIEHIEIIRDANEIERITKHFYKLWKSI